MRHAEIYKVVLRAIDAERRRNKELAKNPHFDQGTTIAYASAARTCTDVKRAVSRAIRAIPTTTQHSADTVRELVKRWRDEANAGYLTGKESIDCATSNRQSVFFQCADELESLLSAASGEKGVGNG